MHQKPPNLLDALRRSLPPNIFAVLDAIAEKAAAIDGDLYLVGGSVRDMLLGLPIKDLDMVVEGNAALLALEASKELSGEVRTYSRFGTATVKLEGQRFDLATARRETYSRPGALPRVSPSGIQDDLARRDLSINAMALALSGSDRGCLLDPYRGREDLSLGLIRILHPGSFVDDATRILRAVRYEQRLDFRLEDETQRMLLKAIQCGILDTVSGDRVRRELDLILSEQHPHLPLHRCGALGILGAIHPPLGNGAGVGALAGHSVGSASLWYLAALSYPLTAQEGEAFVHRLRMPSRWAKVVRDTVAVRLKSGYDPGLRPHLGESGLSPGQLCDLLDQLSLISLQVNALLSESPQVKRALELYLTELRFVKPFLTGKELITLGMAEGPPVGDVLRRLRSARIEGKIATREQELQLAKEYVNNEGGSPIDRV